MASDYTNFADAILITPSIDLTAASVAGLHFTLWYQTEFFYDELSVEISTNGGGSWSGLAVFDGPATWRSYDYTLTGFVGSAVLIRFRLQTDVSVTYAGAYLDDVLVDDVPVPADTLTVSPASMAPAQAQQAQANVVMARLDLSVDANNAVLEQVTVGLSGTGVGSDVSAASVWRDDGDGMFSPLGDVRLGGGAFFGGTVTFFVYQTVTSGIGVRVFVTYDIAPGATVGAFLGVSISGAGAFLVTQPDIASCPPCPFDTYVAGVRTQITAAEIDTVTMTPFGLAPNAAEPGNALVLMGSVTLTVDANSATVSGIRVDRTGTAVDSDVPYANVWLDDGDGLFYWPADLYLAFGFLGGGSTTFSFSSGLSLTPAAPVRLWITFFVDPGATVGAFMGLRIVDASYLIAPPDVVVCVGCPLDTYIPSTRTAITAPSADTLTIAPIDTSPLRVQQGDVRVRMLAVDLTVSANSATLNGLTIDLTGTGTDSDVQGVTVWADDGDDVFEPNDDVMGPTNPFVGGTVVFSLGIPVTPTSPIRLWFSFAIDPGATVGAFVGTGIVDATYATVSAPDSVICSGCPFDSYVPGSKTEIRGPTPDVVTWTPSDLAPTTAFPRAVDVPIMAMSLSVNANQATVSSVRVDRTGTGGDADIAAVRLWRDDGDGVFEPAADNSLASRSFSSGSATFAVTVTVTPATPARLFVSYDIAAGATVGTFFGGAVDSTSLTLLSPDTASCAGCPMNTYVPASKTRIVAPRLTFTPTSTAPGQVQPNDLAVMGRILLAVDTGSATLTSLDVDLTGTGADADIASVQVWLDDGDGAFDAATDAVEATAVFAGGSATFATSVSVAVGSTELLWVTYRIAAGATVGAFVGLGIADQTYATAAAPATANCIGCPLNTYQPGTRTEILVGSADALTVTLTSVAPTTASAGVTRVAMARIGLAASPGPVTLESITATLSGTGTAADIALFSVWLDNGDGSFSASADISLVQGPNVGTLATNVPVSGGDSETLFLVYDFAAGATVGNYVGVSVTSTSFAVGTSNSVSCASCPFDTYVANTKTRITPSSGRVTGTVRHQDGTVLSGVSVELLSGATVIASALTNAAGAFTFTTVVAGTYLVRASAQGYETDSEAVTVPAGGTATVNLVLNPIRGSVTGRVRVAGSGQLIPGARVELLDHAGALVANTTTNANGQFTFDDLDMGRYSLRASTSGHATATVSEFELTFANPAKDVGNIDLTASAPPYTFPLELVALLAIIAVAAVLGLLLLAKFHRKKLAQQVIMPPPVEGVAQRPWESPPPTEPTGPPPPPPPP